MSSQLRRLALASTVAAAWPAAAPADEPARAPAATDLTGRGGTLSDKLRDTGGVVHPTGDVDPAMRKAAPASGSMPVVKPGDLAPGTAR